MNRLGTVVVAGRTYQVTGLRLHGGVLEITASGPGGNQAVSRAPAAVFGADGLAICRGWLVDLPATSAGQTVTIILPLQITSLTPGEGSTQLIWDA